MHEHEVSGEVTPSGTFIHVPLPPSLFDHEWKGTDVPCQSCVALTALKDFAVVLKEQKRSIILMGGRNFDTISRERWL